MLHHFTGVSGRRRWHAGDRRLLCAAQPLEGKREEQGHHRGSIHCPLHPPPLTVFSLVLTRGRGTSACAGGATHTLAWLHLGRTRLSLS
jgi:hypothetical protein